MAILIRTFDSQIDYADGSAALRKLAIRNGQSVSKTHVAPAITWILVIGLAVMLLVILNSPSGRRQYGVKLSDLTPVAWMLAGVAVLIVGVKITTIAWWRAMRKSSIGKSNAIEIRANDQGISADSDLQRMFYPWCFFTRFAETQKSFALHGRAINWGDWLIFVVPVAPLAETSQVDDFRALLARNILPEARRAKEGSTGFPVVMHEPEAAGTAERPISNGLLATDMRTIVLDQIRFEYEDFRIARLGWRRGLRWNWTAILIAAVLCGSIAFAVGAVAKAALIEPFWGVFALLPLMVLLGAMRTLISSRTNLAGAKRGWPRHALNSGPVTIALHEEGISIATPDHQLLLKTSSIIANLESETAFSIVSRYWEIILPKRLLSGDLSVEVRRLLGAKFGPVQPLPRGHIRRIIAPEP